MKKYKLTRVTRIKKETNKTVITIVSTIGQNHTYLVYKNDLQNIKSWLNGDTSETFTFVTEQGNVDILRANVFAIKYQEV